MADPSSNEPVSLGFLPRIALLGILFILELIAITVWLDASSLFGRGGLTGLMGQWGAPILQSILVFVTLVLIFSYFPAKSSIQQLSNQLTHTPITWGWFAGHAAAMAGFGLLSALLFGRNPGAASDWVAGAWLSLGVAGIVLAGFAFLPPKAWRQLLRETGSIWIWAAPAGIGVALFARLARLLWSSAAALTFAEVHAVLRVFLPTVISDPAARIIGTPRFSVTIDPACSGLEGVALILLFSLAWLWFFRHECRFPQALIVIPTGVVAMWLLNAMRIAALILIGNAGATGVALGGFHSQAGWIAFNGVALGFSLAFRRIPWLIAGGQDGAAPVPSRTGENPVAAWLAPFLTILAAAMLSRALSSGFEWLYPLRFFAAAAVLWSFRRKYAGLDWSVARLAPLVGGVVFVMWLAVDWAAGIHPVNAIASGLASLPFPGRIAWLIFRVLAAVVTVPLAEELAFRGFLIRRLMSADFEAINPRTFSWVALLVSSVAFGTLHGGRWIAGTLAGLLYAWAFLRRGSIGDAVVAHATTNALLAGWVLMGGKWYLW
jgi:exosortase E/protease (VPEID-CTERM system)